MGKIWQPQPREVYQQWVKDIIMEASDRLSDWESKFVEDMENRLNFSDLTEGQADKLEQIYTKYTS